MKLISNGIKKHYGKSPEKLLNDRYKGISGIGIVVTASITAISAIIGIVTKLMKVFKKGKKIKGDLEKVTGKFGLKDFAKSASSDLDSDFKTTNGKDYFDTRLTPGEEDFDTTLSHRRHRKDLPNGCMVLVAFLIILAIAPALVKILFF